VKHFCPIDTLRKSTSARRGEVGIRGLAQSQICDRGYVLAYVFLARGAEKSIHRMAAEKRI
jgi:hypothetical protein